MGLISACSLPFPSPILRADTHYLAVCCRAIAVYFLAPLGWWPAVATPAGWPPFRVLHTVAVTALLAVAAKSEARAFAAWERNEASNAAARAVGKGGKSS